MPKNADNRIVVGSRFDDFFACDLQPWRLNRQVAGAQNTAHAKAIASQFEDSKFGYLTINRSDDGTITIIDGHNRLLALELLGREDYIVTCEVFEGLTDAQIAALFSGRNNRKAMDAVTMFLNDLEAGVEEAVVITAILTDFGLYVARTRDAAERAVPAINALRKVYRMPGIYAQRGRALSAALSLLMESWGGGDSMNGNLIEGVGMFMARHGTEIDATALANRLTSYVKGPRGLTGDARTLREAWGGTIAHSVAHVITVQYNKGRRSGRLSDWR